MSDFTITFIHNNILYINSQKKNKFSPKIILFDLGDLKTTGGSPGPE
jgi:hypothetical protein